MLDISGITNHISKSVESIKDENIQPNVLIYIGNVICFMCSCYVSKCNNRPSIGHYNGQQIECMLWICIIRETSEIDSSSSLPRSILLPLNLLSLSLSLSPLFLLTRFCQRFMNIFLAKNLGIIIDDLKWTEVWTSASLSTCLVA